MSLTRATKLSIEQNRIRTIEDNGKWFPLVDIVTYAKDGKSVHKSAVKWLKNNLNNSQIKKLALPETKKSLICIHQDALGIVGMYESHLSNGMDFRAKWADLPDSPIFAEGVCLQLSWENLYSWSINEHIKYTGISRNKITEMRRMALDFRSGINEEKSYVWCKENWIP